MAVSETPAVQQLRVVEAEHDLRNVRDEWIARINDLEAQLRETRRIARERILEAERLVARARGSL